MSSSSPPPPPPNPHSSHFNSKCSGSSSPTRPNPRRSKTTSNPETSWRREPLNDVTNEILGGRAFIGIGRYERRSPRIPSTSSPPTSPTQQQNHYLNHNLPRSSPPRLRRTYTALDLEGGNGNNERVIGRDFMELGLNNRAGAVGGVHTEGRNRDVVRRDDPLETTTRLGRIRTRSRQLTPQDSLLPTLRGAGVGASGRRRTSRDVLENSPTPSNSSRREESEHEEGGEEGSGRRLRRRRTEGGFR